MHVHDVRDLLTDPAVDRSRRLIRLQGQRDEHVEQALAAGWAMRLGPAQCAVFGTLALAMADARIYLVLAALSAVGVVTRHHPVEWLYVWWGPRHGHVPPPGNRAPRRFACLLGAVSFALAAAGLGVDVAWLFWPSALLLIALPAFVATTNICVPSLVFTALLGERRGTCPTLGTALRIDAATPAVQHQRPADDAPWHSDHGRSRAQGHASSADRAVS